MSAVLPHAVRVKLAPLLRLLSSSVDGERLAAVGGIGRVLKGAGLTFHELASAIERPPEPAAHPSQAPSEARKPKPRRSARADAPRGVALSPTRRQTLLVALRLLLRDADALLSRWEVDFVAAIVRQIDGAHPSISARQLEIVERIIHREQGWQS